MDDDHPPFTLQRALDDLKYVVELVLSACGFPSDIAARRTLLARSRESILYWLAPAEAFARRVLLLVALTEPTPNLPEPIRRSERVASAMRDRPPPDLPDNPADWRAVFSEWPSGVGFPRKACQDKRFRGVQRFTDLNAFPLARRIEALIRLARDPAAAIKRMARKIAARRIWLMYAFSRYRHDARPIQTLLNEVQREVDAALLNTS